MIESLEEKRRRASSEEKRRRKTEWTVRHLHAPKLKLRFQVLLLIQQFPARSPARPRSVQIRVAFAACSRSLRLLAIRRQPGVAGKQVLLQLLKQSLRRAAGKFLSLF
jgi:hypothetical protein